jgi:hypothetical protein
MRLTFDRRLNGDSETCSGSTRLCDTKLPVLNKRLSNCLTLIPATLYHQHGSQETSQRLYEKGVVLAMRCVYKKLLYALEMRCHLLEDDTLWRFTEASP